MWCRVWHFRFDCQLLCTQSTLYSALGESNVVTRSTPKWNGHQIRNKLPSETNSQCITFALVYIDWQITWLDLLCHSALWWVLVQSRSISHFHEMFRAKCVVVGMEEELPRKTNHDCLPFRTLHCVCVYVQAQLRPLKCAEPSATENQNKVNQSNATHRGTRRSADIHTFLGTVSRPVRHVPHTRWIEF